jgi:S1-C subfamily serine protease
MAGMKRYVLIALTAGIAALADDDIRTALANLGAEQFAAREMAQQRLLKFAESNHQAVLAACVPRYRQTQDPEVKTRLKEVMASVVDKHLFRAPRGYLGVRLNRVHIRGGQLVVAGTTAPPGAAWVSQVMDDTPAQKAGMQANDFIIAVDGKPLENGSDGFIEYVQSRRPGARLKLSVLRGAATNAIDAVLGELPQAEAERIHTKERGDEFFERWLAEQMQTP